MPSYHDVSRHTSNVALPSDVSQEIWSYAIEESAFMQLARRINIPGTGTTIQSITGEPTANWVDETNPKPVSAHTFGKHAITPYKLAVIEAFSKEFLRDKKGLYDECVRRLPSALGKKFDSTIMGSSAPGSGFDVLGTGVTKKTILPASSPTAISVYDRFVGIDGDVAAANGIMDTIALAPQGKSIVLGATDTTGRPLFTPGVGSNTVGSILGANAAVSKGVYVAGASGSPGTPAVVGVAGDFSGVMWGSVEGIKMSVSDQATIVDSDSNTISLWQSNMVGILFEVELAFCVMDKSQLFLLTGATPS